MLVALLLSLVLAAEPDNGLARADALDSTIQEHLLAGELELADALIAEQLALRVRLLGAEHPDVGITLAHRAWWFSAQQRHEEALETLHEAVAIYPDPAMQLRVARAEIEMGQAVAGVARLRPVVDGLAAISHPQQGPARMLLAEGLAQLGQLAEAQAELARVEAQLDPIAPTLALVDLHNRRAMLAREQGEAGRALDWALSALEAAASLAPDWVPQLRVNLGLAQVDAAEPVRGIATVEQGVAELTAQLGPAHPDVALARAQLAALLHDHGDAAAAVPIYAEVLAALAPLYGAHHPHLDQIRGNQALALLESGAEAEAQALLEEVIARSTVRLGPHSPLVLRDRLNLASVLDQRGDVDAALATVREVAAQLAGRPGQVDLYAHALDVLTRMLEADGRDAEAAEAAATAVDVGLERALEVAAGLAPRQRRAALARWRERLDHYLTLADDPEATLARVVRFKGAEASLSRDQHRALARRFGHEQEERVAALLAARQALAEAALAQADEQTLAALRDERDRTSRELAQASGVSVEVVPEVSVEALCAALPPDTALLELLSWKPRTARRVAAGEPAQLAAWIVRRQQDGCAVSRVPLGQLAPVADEVEGWRALASSGAALTARLDERGKALSRRLLDPLLPVLGEVEAWVVAPDGPLVGLSWAALPTQAGGYLLEEHALTYVGSGLELLRDGGPPPGTGAVVVGGVDFSATASPPCTEEAWAPLPGTRTEAAQVARRLRGAQLWTGEVTEEALRREVPGARVVHLATHGFFLDGDCVEAPSPWVRSGLVLSGAQGRDGLWTSEELASLDLRGTELVVLSACDSGLGEAVSGAGVLGLRRALREAWAEQVVMSLWSVPDAEAAWLMDRFYRQLGRRGAARALREAQLALLARQRRQGEARPELWAGWVLSGVTDSGP